MTVQAPGQAPLGQRGTAHWPGRHVLAVVALYVLIELMLAPLGSETRDVVLTSLIRLSRPPLVDLLANVLVLAAVAAVACRRGTLGRELGLHLPPPRWNVFALALAVLLLGFKLLLALALMASAPAGVGSLEAADAAMLLVVIGPLTALKEEVLYRGVLLGWLCGRLSPASAITLSSAVFAADHSGAARLTALIFGLLLGWCCHRSGSLWPSITIHAASNAGTVLIVTLPVLA